MSIMFPTFSGAGTSPKLSKRFNTRCRNKKNPGEGGSRDKLERRPGARGKKLHHVNNQRRMEIYKT